MCKYLIKDGRSAGCAAGEAVIVMPCVKDTLYDLLDAGKTANAYAFVCRCIR